MWKYTCHNYHINDSNDNPHDTHANWYKNNDLDPFLSLISVIWRWLSNDGIAVGALVYVVMEAVQAAWDATAAGGEKPWAVFNLVFLKLKYEIYVKVSMFEAINFTITTSY